MRLSTTCSAALVLFATGCGSAGNPMGSEGGPCYGNGTCDGGLICASDLCVQVVSCTGIDCSGFGTCEDSGETVACICDPGYRPAGLACIEVTTDACSPNPCEDANSCTANICAADPSNNTAICTYPSEADRTACDDFAPNSGVCIDGGCIDVTAPVTQAVGIVASNNVTGDISELPYELTVTPLGPVVDGVPVDFAVTGTAFFPPVFLNAAISTIPGLTSVTLNALTATPHVRSGALGAPYDLVELTSANPLPEEVAIPILGLPASIPICGPLNVATCPNTCTDGTACSQPGPDVCVGIGDGTCEPRGACICVVENLALPLSSDIVTVTPSGTEILFGWNEDLLPRQTVIATNPPGPNGIRVLAVVLNVGTEGWMGKLVSESPDVAGPLLDSELLSIPIIP